MLGDSGLQYHIVIALRVPDSAEPDLADLSAQLDAFSLRPPVSIWDDLNKSAHSAAQPERPDWSVLDDQPRVTPTVDARYGAISIEWRDMASKSAAEVVDLGYGVIHLYRETETYVPPEQLSSTPMVPVASTSGSTIEEQTSKEEIIGADGTVLAVLAIPSVMSVADFLVFVEPAAEMISQIRILRDAMPNRCMALIKLRSATDALEFREEFNGKPFWAMLDVRLKPWGTS